MTDIDHAHRVHVGVHDPCEPVIGRERDRARLGGAGDAIVAVMVEIGIFQTTVGCHDAEEQKTN